MHTDTLQFPRIEDAPTPTQARSFRQHEQDVRAFLRDLNSATLGDPRRPQVLRRFTRDTQPEAVQEAAKQLLKRDREAGAEDGIGGYQWIDGELRWCGNHNRRRRLVDNGEVSDLLPGSVQVPIASSSYTLHMCNGWLHDRHGSKACGLCCGTEHRIYISNAYPAPNRIGTVWHEIMHACWFESGDWLPDERYDAETWCNVTEKAMGGITPQKYAEIIAFVTLDQFAYPAPQESV